MTESSRFRRVLQFIRQEALQDIFSPLDGHGQVTANLHIQTLANPSTKVAKKEFCALDNVKCDFPVPFVNIKLNVLSWLSERSVCFWKPRNIGDEGMTCLGTCDIGLLLDRKKSMHSKPGCSVLLFR